MLDLTDYATPEALRLRAEYKYDLVGVINHEGDAEWGHYTAVCNRINHENHRDSEWYHFDDLGVSDHEQSQNVLRNAVTFIFELQQDQDYDENEEDRNLAEWYKIDAVK